MFDPALANRNEDGHKRDDDNRRFPAGIDIEGQDGSSETIPLASRKPEDGQTT